LRLRSCSWNVPFLLSSSHARQAGRPINSNGGFATALLHTYLTVCRCVPAIYHRSTTHISHCVSLCASNLPQFYYTHISLCVAVCQQFTIALLHTYLTACRCVPAIYHSSTTHISHCVSLCAINSFLQDAQTPCVWLFVILRVCSMDFCDVSQTAAFFFGWVRGLWDPFELVRVWRNSG
jgi:hypothetical protein